MIGSPSKFGTKAVVSGRLQLPIALRVDLHVMNHTVGVADGIPRLQKGIEKMGEL